MDESLRISFARYIRLTTFRKTGVAVSTAVWVARLDDELLVWTSTKTGKVKRLRNNPAVELSPSSSRGVVPGGAPVLHGTATIERDPAEIARLAVPFRRKYGWQFRLFGLIERPFEERMGPHVILRIRLDH